jgi:hypothetical protein
MILPQGHRTGGWTPDRSSRPLRSRTPHPPPRRSEGLFFWPSLEEPTGVLRARHALARTARQHPHAPPRVSSKDDNGWRRWRRRPSRSSSSVRRSKKARLQAGSEASSTSPPRKDPDYAAAFHVHPRQRRVVETYMSGRARDRLPSALRPGNRRMRSGGRAGIDESSTMTARSTRDCPSSWSLGCDIWIPPPISPVRSVGDNCGGNDT